MHGKGWEKGAFRLKYPPFLSNSKTTIEMLEEKVRKAMKRVDAEKSARAIGAFFRRISSVENKKRKHKSVKLFYDTLLSYLL